MIEKDPKFHWRSAKGVVHIADMDTVHLINTVKMINKMADRHRAEDVPFEFPKCYDAMYIELEYRGVDIDFELNLMFPEL